MIAMVATLLDVYVGLLGWLATLAGREPQPADVVVLG